MRVEGNDFLFAFFLAFRDNCFLIHKLLLVNFASHKLFCQNGLVILVLTESTIGSLKFNDLIKDNPK